MRISSENMLYRCSAGAGGSSCREARASRRSPRPTISSRRPTSVVGCSTPIAVYARPHIGERTTWPTGRTTSGERSPRSAGGVIKTGRKYGSISRRIHAWTVAHQISWCSNSITVIRRRSSRRSPASWSTGAGRGYWLRSTSATCDASTAIDERQHATTRGRSSRREYNRDHAGVAQLVELLLPKQVVAGSSPVSRSVIGKVLTSL